MRMMRNLSLALLALIVVLLFDRMMRVDQHNLCDRDPTYAGPCGD